MVGYRWSNTDSWHARYGLFSAIEINNSTDFDDMIFPMGSIFIFGSWVCKANDEGNLQGCLVKA
jgi:hypothetical protein